MSTALPHIDTSDHPGTLAQAGVPRGCALWHCGRCDQHWLRYTEYGDYCIDHRSRRLDPALFVGVTRP